MLYWTLVKAPFGFQGQIRFEDDIVTFENKSQAIIVSLVEQSNNLMAFEWNKILRIPNF